MLFSKEYILCMDAASKNKYLAGELMATWEKQFDKSNGFF